MNVIDLEKIATKIGLWAFNQTPHTFPFDHKTSTHVFKTALYMNLCQG